MRKRFTESRWLIIGHMTNKRQSQNSDNQGFWHVIQGTFHCVILTFWLISFRRCIGWIIKTVLCIKCFDKSESWIVLNIIYERNLRHHIVQWFQTFWFSAMESFLQMKCYIIVKYIYKMGKSIGSSHSGEERSRSVTPPFWDLEFLEATLNTLSLGKLRARQGRWSLFTFT